MLVFSIDLLCVHAFIVFERSFITRLHMLVNLFVVCWCTAFERGTVGDVSYAKVLQGISFCLFRWWGCPVPVLRSARRFVVFISSKMSCCGISWFCLAPCLFGASFALNRSCLRFHEFCLAPSLLWVSFLLERFCLCFHDFDWAPRLSGAMFLLEHFRLCFRDFDRAPSLSGASFLLKQFCLLFCDFGWAPSLSGASFLSDYFLELVGRHWTHSAMALGI
jgi:hypothetical protein